MKENPFTPTFGEIPLHMAGRESILGELSLAFKQTSRHPNLTTAITGARGTGKTALLSAASASAESRGWVVVRTVALPGMLEDILISTRKASEHLISSDPKKRLSGVEVGQTLSVQWENEEELSNWRSNMSDVLDKLAAHDTGLLITVDEVQPKLTEMVRLAAIYQLFVTEGRKVALLMAGLPHNILQMENDKTVSFLCRAQKHQLGRIPDYDVEDAMRRTIEESGRTISQAALRGAVAAADGFAYMMQLVGFRVWNQHPNNKEITMTDVESGINLATLEFTDRIVKTTYDALSKGDRRFLQVMASSDAGLTTPEIAKALKKTNSYATQYKNRLLGQGVISESVNRTLNFDLPLMKDYVRSFAGD